MKNPFTLSFGREPANFIERELLNNDILESFTDSNPDYQVCMITGVRGSGKTVALTSISNQLRKEKDWVVVDLNPERDLLISLTAQLSNQGNLMEYFKDAKINLSFLGFGLEIDGVPPITDIVVALDRMLEKLTKSNKKVLITIDEVSSSTYIREFASQFQIFMRKDYNVFLIMTGLHENIYELQNEKTLTFLYRAPKIVLKPLNEKMVAKKYMDVFDIEYSEAMDMANMVKGYPFAFQVLGYLCFKYHKKWNEVLMEFDAYMEEYVYEKIWSELSNNDQQVLLGMASSKENKVEAIRNIISMNSNTFTVYRNRLIKKGLIESKMYGTLDFTLPRFSEFVLQNML